MSDLIPTTADVRDVFSSESSDSTYANRMFDAWLARYKAKIVAKTEERIIKLLEEQIPVCEPENPDADSCQRGDCGCAIEQGNIEDIIELIKGETK